jgi:hypothetical protein
VVNLRLRSAEAARLGVAGHVCELQLTPAAFADAMVGFTPDLHLVFTARRSPQLCARVAFSLSSSPPPSPTPYGWIYT